MCTHSVLERPVCIRLPQLCLYDTLLTPNLKVTNGTVGVLFGPIFL